jgi:hypothetical protein
VPPRRRWTDNVAEEWRSMRLKGQMVIPGPGEFLARCAVCEWDGPHEVIEDDGTTLRGRCDSCKAHVVVPAE